MKKINVLLVLTGIFITTNVFSENAVDTKGSPANLPEWRDHIETLLPIGDRVVPILTDHDDPQLRQELYSRLFAAFSVAYMGFFHGDTSHPDFWPIFNSGHNIGAPNPDSVYYLAHLDDNGIYKVSGYRGTVRIADVQLGTGTFYTRGEGPPAPSFTNYDIDDLHIDKNGYFEVIISPQRPGGYQGDWWKLPPKSTHILLRQYSYDWVNERDGQYAIERLDTPAISPRLTAEEIADKLQDIAAWAENWAKTTMTIANNYKERGLVNKVALRDLSSVGGFTGKKQMYIDGQYQVNDDEALILEFEEPEGCRYWSVQLTSMVTWSTLDHINHQVNLNGHTAAIDKDGKFRAVISTQDPGVPNWLDTVGYDKGTIFTRFMECENTPPSAEITRVKLTDLRKHLPEETAVVTAEERDAALRLRRKGAQLRNRW